MIPTIRSNSQWKGPQAPHHGVLRLAGHWYWHPPVGIGSFLLLPTHHGLLGVLGVPAGAAPCNNRKFFTSSVLLPSTSLNA